MCDDADAVHAAPDAPQSPCDAEVEAHAPSVAPPGDAAPSGDAAAPPRRDAIARYVHFLQRWRVAVILLWVAIVAVGMVGIINVFGNLKLQARPRARCARWALSRSRVRRRAAACGGVCHARATRPTGRALLAYRCAR
jgi:hypothetical protein